ncbi:hypothetical protein [Nocardia miyunensis]|uniref:hypothetical protein n=1 Tax=Nocardia miyunensis TaxID=282684 RepID=UPI000831E384|nr:hypothetical protein [Nocardia miyunensis]
MRKFVVSALVVSAIGTPAATAGASPNAVDAPVYYTAKPSNGSMVIRTDGGSLAIEDGAFKIKSTSGKVLAGTDLSFRVDDFVFPIAAAIKDHTATLTPEFDLAHATYRPVALPYEDQAPWKNQYDREQSAWSRLASTITTGAVIGGAVGTVGGAAIGCLLGGIAGATVATAAIIGLFGAFIPAAAVGCIGGMIAAAALGTVAGQLFVTAPIAIAAAIQYLTTINSPMPARPAQ